MPQIFKALSSAIVWILFVNGCISFVASGVTRIIGEEPWPSMVAWIVSILSFTLAALMIKVRHQIQ